MDPSTMSAAPVPPQNASDAQENRESEYRDKGLGKGSSFLGTPAATAQKATKASISGSTFAQKPSNEVADGAGSTQAANGAAN